MDVPVLQVDQLELHYKIENRLVPALNRVSFSVPAGQVLGLVGESGCGKSTLARAIMGVLPRNGRVVGGSIRLNGHDLLTMRPAELRRLRWVQMSMVFQSAMSALNPVLAVGAQIRECLTTHGVDAAAAQRRAEELIGWVGLTPRVLGQYPHQLSGGMRQRVILAMAWALEPRLVIADEPTTALDVITQQQVLDQLISLQRSHQQAVILITHDMAVVAERADAVVVLYAGSVAEWAPVSDVFHRPTHPYTMGLIGAIPGNSSGPLVTIPGSPPAPELRTGACSFHPRCPFAQPVCRSEEPPLTPVAPDHYAACHFTDQAAEFRRLALQPETWVSTPA